MILNGLYTQVNQNCYHPSSSPAHALTALRYQHPIPEQSFNLLPVCSLVDTLPISAHPPHLSFVHITVGIQNSPLLSWPSFNPWNLNFGAILELKDSPTRVQSTFPLPRVSALEIIVKVGTESIEFISPDIALIQISIFELNFAKSILLVVFVLALIFCPLRRHFLPASFQNQHIVGSKLNLPSVREPRPIFYRCYSPQVVIIPLACNLCPIQLGGHSTSALEVLSESSFILVTILPPINALTLLSSIRPLTLVVFIPFFVVVNSIAILPIVFPLAFVVVTVVIYVLALPMLQPTLHASPVQIAVVEQVGASPFDSVILPLACIYIALLVVADPIPVFAIVFDSPHILDSIILYFLLGLFLLNLDENGSLDLLFQFFVFLALYFAGRLRVESRRRLRPN